MNRTTFVFSIILAVLLSSCDRSTSQQNASMTTVQIIRQNTKAPIGLSIGPVAASLAGHSIFVATDSAASSQPTTMILLDKLRFKTAQDNQGREWAYAYTDQGELLRAFPQGSPYAELSFKDLFQIIDRDTRFAGIFINAGSDSSYPIPREVFYRVKEALK